jgi:ribosomal protein L15
LPLRLGMLGVPMVFDAAHPPVLNGQPRPADHKAGRGHCGRHQSGVVVAGREGGQARNKRNQRQADHNQPRHDHVVLHREAISLIRTDYRYAPTC